MRARASSARRRRPPRSARRTPSSSTTSASPEDGAFYYVMELLDGLDPERWCGGSGRCRPSGGLPAAPGLPLALRSRVARAGPPRHQAGQHLPLPLWRGLRLRQGARLRPGEGSATRATAARRPRSRGRTSCTARRHSSRPSRRWASRPRRPGRHLRHWAALPTGCSPDSSCSPPTRRWAIWSSTSTPRRARRPTRRGAADSAGARPGRSSRAWPRIRRERPQSARELSRRLAEVEGAERWKQSPRPGRGGTRTCRSALDRRRKGHDPGACGIPSPSSNTRSWRPDHRLRRRRRARSGSTRFGSAGLT